MTLLSEQIAQHCLFALKTAIESCTVIQHTLLMPASFSWGLNASQVQADLSCLWLIKDVEASQPHTLQDLMQRIPGSWERRFMHDVFEGQCLIENKQLSKRHFPGGRRWRIPGGKVSRLFPQALGLG